MSINSKIRLQDHQADSERTRGAPASLDASLELKDTAVELHTDDGRSVWVELENGNIRVHSYNRSREAPLNLVIPLEGDIEVDDHDYNMRPFY